MIKLNLNKTKVESTQMEATLTTNPGNTTSMTSFKDTALSRFREMINKTSEEITPAIIIKASINLGILICCPLGIKIYEVRGKSALKKAQEQVQMELDSAKQEVAGLDGELKKYEKIKEDSIGFLKRKEFLKKIASSRLIIPEALDFIQNNLPENVWLNSLNIKLTNKETNEFEMRLQGNGINELNVNSFESILGSFLDPKTVTSSVQDVKSEDNSVKVSFSIEGKR